ncbi:polysaccharide deacetylase family protein [Luteimonas sp. SDU101]|uniref:polysaccharide deacetylase family protein n=1 Tax=Luteimonas sp. SDU101 TaxID=3422593 RepID=UPI003EB91A29
MSIESAIVAASGRQPAPGSRRQRLAERAHAWGMLPLMRTVRGLFRRDLRVLAYHRVREVGPDFAFDRALVSASPEGFRSQMRHLAARFNPVCCREVTAALDGGPALPRDAVLVTFDDGYDDNHDVAFPILRETGVPATFFVSTGHIDSGMPYAYDWLAHLVVTMDEARLRIPELEIDVLLPPGRDARHATTSMVLDRLKYLDDAGQQAVIDALQARCGRPRTAPHADCRPMTWDQLREMRDGGMEIGGHGVHHRMLAKLPDDALAAEIGECQARLTAELGAPAIAVSYPVGGPDAYDARVIEAVRAQGFRVGFSYVSGVSAPDQDNRYRLLRVPVESDVGEPWFQGIVAAPELFSHASTLRVYPS